jgi:hypothetical protein
MSYTLNILMCVGMILLDILLQCSLFIIVIDLSITFNSVEDENRRSIHLSVHTIYTRPE